MSFHVGHKLDRDYIEDIWREAASEADPPCRRCGSPLHQDDGQWRDARGSTLCSGMQYHEPVPARTAAIAPAATEELSETMRPLTRDEIVRLVNRDEERRAEDRRERERNTPDRREDGDRREVFRTWEHPSRGGALKVSRTVAEDTDSWSDIDWNNYSAGFEDGLLHNKDLSAEPDHGDIYLAGYSDGLTDSI